MNKFKKVTWTLCIIAGFITIPIGFIFGIFIGGFMVGLHTCIDNFIEIHNKRNKKS